MSDRNRWLDVRDSMGQSVLAPGGRFSELMHHAPSRLLELTALYKFAARMIGPDKNILEPRCHEGFGTWILGTECGHCMGMEEDRELVELAARNYPEERTTFAAGDFLSADTGTFDAIVCLDMSGDIKAVMDRITASLKENGVAVLSGGSAPEGVAVGPDGWLAGLAGQYFRHVFAFNANDETIRAGFDPAARTHVVVACKTRQVGERDTE